MKKYSSNSSQYFEVICLFVRTENLTEQFFHLLQSTVELVKLHPVIERFDMDKEDTALIGFFDLITTFLQVQSSLKFSIGPKGKSGMVHEIFNCLFELPKDPKPNHLLPPRCKTEASRNAAFRLLTELVKDCNINFVQLMDLILENHLGKIFLFYCQTLFNFKYFFKIIWKQVNLDGIILLLMVKDQVQVM